MGLNISEDFFRIFFYFFHPLCFTFSFSLLLIKYAGEAYSCFHDVSLFLSRSYGHNCNMFLIIQNFLLNLFQSIYFRRLSLVAFHVFRLENCGITVFALS